MTQRLLFPINDVPHIAPLDPPAPRKVKVAVFNKVTGKIAQVVRCSETDMHNQHIFWDGHHYMEVEDHVDPTLHAICPTTRAILDKDRADELAEQKKREARVSTRDRIVGGFISSALGALYDYGSTQIDQQNMMVTAMTGGLLMCGLDGEWALRDHTQAQAAQVLKDFVAHRDEHRAAFHAAVE